MSSEQAKSKPQGLLLHSIIGTIKIVPFPKSSLKSTPPLFARSSQLEASSVLTALPLRLLFL
jgi:hypothetical protein